MVFTYQGPFKSNRKYKKFYVIVTKGNKTRTVHYGDTRYQSYDQHGDKDRRDRYIARASKIKNKQGKLTIDDPFSPTYWSMRKLWSY